MKISELVKELEKVKENQGDLVVGYFRYTGCDEEWKPIICVDIELDPKDGNSVSLV